MCGVLTGWSVVCVGCSVVCVVFQGDALWCVVCKGDGSFLCIRMGENEIEVEGKMDHTT